MRRVSGFVLLVLLGWSLSLEAATRLGLGVTQEELDIWRARRTDNSTTINGYTYQNIYNTRILGPANAFVADSHPGGDGHWTGNSQGGCWKAQRTGSDHQPPRDAGMTLMQSAFVFLLSGTTSYADAVKTELLDIIGQSGLVWTNASLWCPYDGTFAQLIDDEAFQVVPWIMRLLFAYDYLLAGGYAGFTTPQQAAIAQWFSDAAYLWQTVLVGTLQVNAMSGAYDNPPDTTCDGGPCPGTSADITYFGGWVPSGLSGMFTNKVGSPALLSAAAGILTNDAELVRIATLWFQYVHRFGTNDVGTLVDQNRWADCDPPCVQSGWGHVWSLLSNMVGVADVIGRSGDTSLYTFQSPGGQFGSDGANVGFREVLLYYSRLTNKTILHYGTTSAAQLTPEFLISWDTQSPTYWDFLMMVSNLFYEETEITTAVTRGAASLTSCGDPQYGCYNGLYVSYPDLPFMFGNMQGVVHPHNLTAGAPTVVLSASPDTITSGASSLLSWSSTDATSCTASNGWSGSKALTGSESISPTVTTTYTLTCTGAIAPDGSDSATVTVVAAAPVACYPFDGTGADSTGLGHTATLQGGATYTTGVFNQAVLLDGVNDYVSVAHAADLNLTGDMTVDFWGWLDTAAASQVLLAKEDFVAPMPVPFLLELSGTPLNYQWYHHSSGGDFSAVLLFTAFPVPLLTWHHVAVTRTMSSAAVTLWINGSAVQTLAGWTDLPAANTVNLVLGSATDQAAGRFVQGRLDEVCLYNYVLSPAEILARATLPLGPSAPVIWRVTR